MSIQFKPNHGRIFGSLVLFFIMALSGCQNNVHRSPVQVVEKSIFDSPEVGGRVGALRQDAVARARVQPSTAIMPVIAQAIPAPAPEAFTTNIVRESSEDEGALRKKYHAGDAGAAYRLGKLLLSSGRGEEAELVLDYAARHGSKEAERKLASMGIVAIR
ncbi:hypothetical protein ACYPKM_03435 [Pseudomonas aeruginosa]